MDANPVKIRRHTASGPATYNKKSVSVSATKLIWKKYFAASVICYENPN